MSHCVPRVSEIVEDGSGEKLRAQRMEPVFEGCGDAEVAATAADTPEQIGIFGRAGSETSAIGRHDLGRQQIVAGEPVFAAELAKAAAECQSGYSGIAVDAHGRRKAAGLRGGVELAQAQARLRANGPAFTVDLDPLHA